MTRGFGDFQRAQMSDTDPRIHELFNHLRHALDALEQITLRPHRKAAERKAEIIETKTPSPLIQPEEPKLSYTIKEVRKLVGISTATLYQVLGRRELRAVKLAIERSSWQGICRNGWTVCQQCDEQGRNVGCPRTSCQPIILLICADLQPTANPTKQCLRFYRTDHSDIAPFRLQTLDCYCRLAVLRVK